MPVFAKKVILNKVMRVFHVTPQVQKKFAINVLVILGQNMGLHQAVIHFVQTDIGEP